MNFLMNDFDDNHKVKLIKYNGGKYFSLDFSHTGGAMRDSILDKGKT